MTKCDGCGHCVDICPSDIAYRQNLSARNEYRAQYVLGVLPCVKASSTKCHRRPWLCGFRSHGTQRRVLREEEKGTISWKIKFRNGEVKDFVSPITTQPWGEKIPKLAELAEPTQEETDSQLLCFEPDALNIERGLPVIDKEKFKQGVYY